MSNIYLKDGGKKRIEVENIAPDMIVLLIVDDCIEYETITLSNREAIGLASELLAYTTKKDE